MEDDLEEEVAQLLLQPGHIVPLDRVGDLVCLLDRVRRDRGECLLDVPRTALLRVPQLGHHGGETLDRRGRIIGHRRQGSVTKSGAAYGQPNLKPETMAGEPFGCRRTMVRHISRIIYIIENLKYRGSIGGWRLVKSPHIQDIDGFASPADSACPCCRIGI